MNPFQEVSRLQKVVEAKARYIEKHPGSDVFISRHEQMVTVWPTNDNTSKEMTFDQFLIW